MGDINFNLSIKDTDESEQSEQSKRAKQTKKPEVSTDRQVTLGLFINNAEAQKILRIEVKAQLPTELIHLNNLDLAKFEDQINSDSPDLFVKQILSAKNKFVNDNSCLFTLSDASVYIDHCINAAKNVLINYENNLKALIDFQNSFDEFLIASAIKSSFAELAKNSFDSLINLNNNPDVSQHKDCLHLIIEIQIQIIKNELIFTFTDNGAGLIGKEKDKRFSVEQITTNKNCNSAQIRHISAKHTWDPEKSLYLGGQGLGAHQLNQQLKKGSASASLLFANITLTTINGCTVIIRDKIENEQSNNNSARVTDIVSSTASNTNAVETSRPLISPRDSLCLNLKNSSLYKNRKRNQTEIAANTTQTTNNNFTNNNSGQSSNPNSQNPRYKSPM